MKHILFAISIAFASLFAGCASVGTYVASEQVAPIHSERWQDTAPGSDFGMVKVRYLERLSPEQGQEALKNSIEDCPAVASRVDVTRDGPFVVKVRYYGSQVIGLKANLPSYASGIRYAVVPEDLRHTLSKVSEGTQARILMPTASCSGPNLVEGFWVQPS